MKKLLLLPFLLLFIGCNDVKKVEEINDAPLELKKDAKIIQEKNLTQKTEESNATKEISKDYVSTSTKNLESEVSKEEWIEIQKENEMQERMMEEMEQQEKAIENSTKEK
jgi:K+-transporting ATPase c subunit